MSEIVTTTLSCGMPLLTERISGVRSAGLCWLLPAGAVHDPSDRLGLAAIHREMLLRGAGDLDSRAHADAMDRVGAGRSTGVSTFHLSLASSFVGSHTAEVLPLLADMVTRPRLEPDALAPAASLAVQEIQSLADDPQRRAVLAARARHYPSAIGRSGLGTQRGIESITQSDVVQGWAQRARPQGSILTLAGDVDPKAVADQLNDILADWKGDAPNFDEGTPGTRGYDHVNDDANQVQIILIHDAPPEPDPNSTLERVLISVLSGGMASRLFTEVREKRGLCYTVSASYAAERTFGRVLAYVGTTPERAQESLDVLVAELNRIGTPEGAVTQGELDRALIGLKSSLVFSGESTGARATSLARDQFRLGRGRSLAELADELDRVTLDRVNDYARTRTMGEVTIQTLGPSALTPPV
ncbi:insulinase family protein [Roseiflexus sp. AH-315-K22]|nr:insulinase family protein [Roseiflexus sp. AH-315-K22]